MTIAVKHPPIPRHRRILAFACCAVALLSPTAFAQNQSAPAILQWFEGTYKTQEKRAGDFFLAGYGSLYLPPTGLAQGGGFSVGYDVYDRFHLGKPGDQTRYGTEIGLKTTVNALHRAGASVYVDFIINHNAFWDSSTTNFVRAGDYPGFVTTLPNSTDGDFHSAFPNPNNDVTTRLSGLIDIDHRTNHPFIRNPVPGFSNNIPGGTNSGFGRIADVPSETNRRFYPDTSLQPIIVFDPKTGEGGITIYPFNNANPMAGEPVPENAMGYLMRNAQWLVQHVGVDGFRIDAAKHVYPFALDYFDRAVYRSSFRTNLDGSQKQVFSFQEVYDGGKPFLQGYIRKDINPADPGTVGGNRDVLDFPLFFALHDHLTDNGTVNNWHKIRNASIDSQDDGLANNGSQGVAFAGSHDDGNVHLSNVAHAFILMRPGNAVVYFNAKEQGNTDFPKDGRGDALGGFYGDAITTLVNLRNTHGRGNYRERWIDDAFNPDGFSNVYVYEREKSAVVALNSRLDGGFDTRNGVQTAFTPGTRLIELTGNAASGTVDPFNDIPDVVTVDGSGKINVRIPRNRNANGVEHGKGYVIYGLPTPRGNLTISGTSRTLAPQTPTAATNASARLAAIDVVTSDSFEVQLFTTPVVLSDGYRDRDADGDNAVFRIDEGLDLNRNGAVDNVTPGSVTYGFEEFHTFKRTGLADPNGNGEYRQQIDATTLAEGYHYVEARAFRHRTDNGPTVYTPFKRVIYVDCLKPLSAVESFDAITPGQNENRRVTVRSTDLTADNVHVFFDLPAALTDDQVLAMVGSSSQASNLDRDLWTKDKAGLTHGNHVVTVVTYELTGNRNVQRFPGKFTSTIFGAGLADVNFDGNYNPTDVTTFRTILHSDDTQFNPAADLNADGRVNDTDLFQLGPRLRAVGAAGTTHLNYNNLLLSPRAGRTRIFAGTLDNGEGSALVKSDAGHMILAGPQVHGVGASLTIQSGRLEVTPSAGELGANLSVIVQSTAELLLNAPQRLKSLRVEGGVARSSIVYAEDVTTSNGTLEVGGALVLTPTDPVAALASLENQLRLGRDNEFTGPGIYNPASLSDGVRSLAAMRNLDESGQPIITQLFSGHPVLAGAVVAMYTLDGDSDWDGSITADDYARLDRGFLERRSGYRNGDLNYDDNIDLDDYSMIDAAFLSQLAPPAASVPEPALGILGYATMVTLFQRHRRRARRSS